MTRRNNRELSERCLQEDKRTELRAQGEEIALHRSRESSGGVGAGAGHGFVQLR